METFEILFYNAQKNTRNTFFGHICLSQGGSRDMESHALLSL